MSTSSNYASRTVARMLTGSNLEVLVDRISPRSIEDEPLPGNVPEPRAWTDAAHKARINFLRSQRKADAPILTTLAEGVLADDMKGHIENFIGMSQVPTGLVGPVRVNGTAAKGDFYVPMATTEGALVASYNRGALAVSRCGGTTSVCLTEAVQRTPTFRFRTFRDAGPFLIWALSNVPQFQAIAAKHTSHGVLEEVKPNVDGNQITLSFEYSTGDAAGQNMATICTEAICQYIIERSPIKPVRWYVEGNLSGDKKATAQSFASVRGKKVTAEAFLSREIVRHDLRTTPEAMLDYWKTSILNGVQSGSIGVNGHYANGLAAIFVACGQDIACVAEACVGTTRFDITEDGGLYVSVTLPNLIVGTVGGGTGLPTQRECLNIMGCVGTGTARKFAEICAAAILGGEVSIVAAIAAGDLSKAHALFGRRRVKPEPDVTAGP